MRPASSPIAALMVRAVPLRCQRIGLSWPLKMAGETNSPSAVVTPALCMLAPRTDLEHNVLGLGLAEP